MVTNFWGFLQRLKLTVFTRLVNACISWAVMPLYTSCQNLVNISRVTLKFKRLESEIVP